MMSDASKAKKVTANSDQVPSGYEVCYDEVKKSGGIGDSCAVVSTVLKKRNVILSPVPLHSFSEKTKMYAVKDIVKTVQSFADNHDTDSDDEIIKDALLLMEKKRKRG
jgi:hypothetical protein